MEDKRSLGLKKKKSHLSLLIFLSMASGDKSRLFSESRPHSELCIISDKEFYVGEQRKSLTISAVASRLQTMQTHIAMHSSAGTGANFFISEVNLLSL